jgi:hypothetical protein
VYSLQDISRIDREDAVEPLLDRPQQPVRERRLAGEDPRHVTAERFDEESHTDQKENVLKDQRSAHFGLAVAEAAAKPARRDSASSRARFSFSTLTRGSPRRSHCRPAVKRTTRR